MPKENDKRVAICKYTNKKVLQMFIDKKWLCLHNDNEKDDIKDIEEFETFKALKSIVKSYYKKEVANDTDIVILEDWIDKIEKN